MGEIVSIFSQNEEMLPFKLVLPFSLSFVYKESGLPSPTRG